MVRETAFFGGEYFYNGFDVGGPNSLGSVGDKSNQKNYQPTVVDIWHRLKLYFNV